MQPYTEEIRHLQREPVAIHSAYGSASLPQREFPAAALTITVSSAFHASSAHFTRAGNRDTPLSARSEPSGSVSLSFVGSVDPFTISLNFVRSPSISPADFPFTSCVIIEADA